MFVVKYKKIFFLISAILVAASIFSVVFFGLNLGTDFKGGSVLEFSYPTQESVFEEVKSTITNQLEPKTFTLRTSGENGFILRTDFLTESEKTEILSALSQNGNIEIVEERFSSIGPVIGSELKRKALIAIVLAIIAIILFIAFSFRRVSKPVSSWNYSLAAIIALAHDIIIPVGLFAILGHWFSAEVDILFVMALLAILGLSVNDTIVVFDRIRENLLINQQNNKREEFEETVGKSLSQTFARSINTSLTTLLVLLALYFLGAEVSKSFALVLITGLFFGTYSSIFLASPLLIALGRLRKKAVK